MWIMVWEFQCPVDDCGFSYQANEQGRVVESAQEHIRDAHGDMPTREEVESSIVGPG